MESKKIQFIQEYLLKNSKWSNRLKSFQKARDDFHVDTIPILNSIVAQLKEIGYPIENKINTLLSLDKLYRCCFVSSNVEKENPFIYEIGLKGFFWAYEVDDYFDDQLEFYHNDQIGDTIKKVKRINDIFHLKSNLSIFDKDTNSIEKLTIDLVSCIKQFSETQQNYHSTLFHIFLQKCIDYTNSIIPFNLYRAQNRVLDSIIISLKEIDEMESALTIHFKQSKCVMEMLKDLSWLLFGFLAWDPYTHYSNQQQSQQSQQSHTLD
ncbi:hypothetical protein CYY_003320 [Polysphondylium violaceum]|uniref:Uncharacterized protein n=1 Tax=Polysphondylium violaceum TaxID=133409 RepID=A0A8J4PX81_9MYCE|nr:hypothetical protein CYY_003320 [Polysphondylium violaceum]